MGKYKKISARYCGLYVITKKINDQSFELEIPPHIEVHNVLHVNLLKKNVLDSLHVLDDNQLAITKNIQPKSIPQICMKILRY